MYADQLLIPTCWIPTGRSSPLIYSLNKCTVVESPSWDTISNSPGFGGRGAFWLISEGSVHGQHGPIQKQRGGRANRGRWPSQGQQNREHRKTLWDTPSKAYPHAHLLLWAPFPYSTLRCGLINGLIHCWIQHAQDPTAFWPPWTHKPSEGYFRSTPPYFMVPFKILLTQSSQQIVIFLFYILLRNCHKTKL